MLVSVQERQVENDCGVHYIERQSVYDSRMLSSVHSSARWNWISSFWPMAILFKLSARSFKSAFYFMDFGTTTALTSRKLAIHLSHNAESITPEESPSLNTRPLGCAKVMSSRRILAWTNHTTVTHNRKQDSLLPLLTTTSRKNALPLFQN